jgi:hypothetical protein
MRDNIWGKRVVIMLVALIGMGMTAFSQLSLRTWTGISSNQFADPLNWIPNGVPSVRDSIVIPLAGNCVVTNTPVSLGSARIATGGKMTLNQGGVFTVSGALFIDSGATFQVSASVEIYLTDIIVNGKFNMAPGSNPRLSLRGEYTFGPFSIFNLGRSTVIFVRPGRQLVLPAFDYYDLIVDSVGSMITSGSVHINHQIVLNMPLSLQPQDTLYVASGDSLAIAGSGPVEQGTIVRAIDTLALSGGSYRFHYAHSRINFFRRGIVPTQITMTSVPGVFPQNLDTNLVFKHYYDIRQIGGSGFRLRLSFEYDPNEARMIDPTERYSIYRSPDYGTTWIEIPASSVDTVTRVISSDSITAFSRYSFGRRYGMGTTTDTIQATAGSHGTLSPSGAVSVSYGGSQQFTITPDVGYHRDSLLVDGVKQDSITSYTFANVIQNHTIRATFAINIDTIGATSGPNGSISPSGEVYVNYGGTQQFTITPDVGYLLHSLLVDGVKQDSTTSYTFSNVTANHTIGATFALTPGALTLRTWTGAHSDRYDDSANWSPIGLPEPTDSVVIPATGRSIQIGSGLSTEIGSLHVLENGTLSIQYAANLTLHGPLAIDSGGVVLVDADMSATMGDVVINGQLSVSSANTPQFLCRGFLFVGASGTFVPGQSSFIFRNPTNVVSLPPLGFHDLRVDSVIAVATKGNLEVHHQLVVNAPLWMRAQDTLSITSGDTTALSGTGSISMGTIIRTITPAVAHGGGTYRFHDAGTAMNFLPEGTLPTTVMMTSVPGVFPQNLDTTLVFKHYYDIHQTGGSGFRLRLSFAYDPAEAGVIAPTDRFAIYRSPDYGTTWIEIPATSFDTVAHVISADSISGFSRYAFGRRNDATSVGRESTVPSRFALSQNYPNPFNPSTLIRYELPVTSRVTLKLYDALGRPVNVLIDNVEEAGERMVGVNGAGLASGVYYYRFEATGVADRTKQFSRTGKMVLVK